MSFHSHGDRSFLDDQTLALVSGDLRAEGVANDLVVVAFPRDETAPAAPNAADDSPVASIERRLLEALAPYAFIVFERVWSRDVIVRLRAALPGRVFIYCRGEHVLADPPADFVCDGDLRACLPALLAYLRGEAAAPPPGTRVREGRKLVSPARFGDVPPAPRRFEPNLRPVLVNPEWRPSARTFSVSGNRGCPYQADARKNPLYEGVTIPEGYGRGCAFCTTGNRYEGQPNAETAASVTEQLRYVRTAAPELDCIVLKDQNPFGYLTEVVRTCAAEAMAPFTLLIETRVDWFNRNLARFEEALAIAGPAGLRLAPYLIGIENFSQRELDRYNKGIDAHENVAFLEALSRWEKEYGAALDLSHASFGFVLFSPWTTLDDLAVNLGAIRKTHFERFRGNVLLSRARLYPDTALYYLAERDGLLADSFEDATDDASRRYGYYPSHPWRFQSPVVGHFARVAAVAVEATGGKDQVRLFDALLRAFAETDDWGSITAEGILRAVPAVFPAHGPRRVGAPSAGDVPVDFSGRFARLVRPLRFDLSFADGWRFDDVRAAPGLVSVHLSHEGEGPLVVELVPRGEGPRLARSRHYDIRHQSPALSPRQRAAVESLCHAILRNDR